MYGPSSCKAVHASSRLVFPEKPVANSAGEDTSRIITTGPEGLYFEVLNITGVAPEHPFVIKIDRAQKYKLVDEILDAMRRAGAQHLILMTDQRTVDG